MWPPAPPRGDSQMHFYSHTHSTAISPFFFISLCLSATIMNTPWNTARYYTKNSQSAVPPVNYQSAVQHKSIIPLSWRWWGRSRAGAWAAAVLLHFLLLYLGLSLPYKPIWVRVFPFVYSLIQKDIAIRKETHFLYKTNNSFPTETIVTIPIKLRIK